MPDRDRDKSVEQWLRQTPVPGAQADDCLDAETLAAWAEGLLEGPQRATAEAHASNCARCQAMLAVMVRTTPPAPESTGSPLRKWLMMLGPPMAAAAAVALWFAVDRDRRTPVLDDLGKQAKAEVESTPTAVMPRLAPPVTLEEDRKLPPTSGDADLQRRERAAQTLADARKEREALESAPKTVALAPARERPEANEKKDLGAAKREDVITGSDRLGAAALAPVASPAAPPPPPAAPRPAESVQAAAGNRPAPAAVVPGPPPQQQANQAQNQAQNQAPNQNQVQVTAESPAVQRQQQALEERVVVADKAAARAAGDSAAAGRSAGRAGVFADSTTSGFRGSVGDFELAAPRSTIRWRVVEGRTVQRSPDAGSTWSNRYTAPAGVFLTAGAAPSPTVVWLVGRAGAIVVSGDGVAWPRVTFPEAIDLASVVATDARAATVTTVDGRRFATADGGRTWARQ